jgi:hypothetical protein
MMWGSGGVVVVVIDDHITSHHINGRPFAAEHERLVIFFSESAANRQDSEGQQRIRSQSALPEPRGLLGPRW